jgi:hypothetical protein
MAVQAVELRPATVSAANTSSRRVFMGISSKVQAWEVFDL